MKAPGKSFGTCPLHPAKLGEPSDDLSSGFFISPVANERTSTIKRGVDTYITGDSLSFVVEAIFGNRTAEKVLLFLVKNDQSYAQEIANRVKLSLNLVQRQLKRFEAAGIIAGQVRGRMRFFSLNPRYPFTPELRALLSKALTFLPAKEQAMYDSQRRRPRKSGKPL